MQPYVKGTIRIAVSVVFGFVIVLGAFYLRDHAAEHAPSEGEIVALTGKTPARQYIQTEDSNRDGISDWEEALLKKAEVDAAGLPELAPLGVGTTTSPDTLTEAFAQTFFEDYLRGNMAGSITSENQEEFLISSITSLEMDTRDELYTAEDVIIGDDEMASLRAYGNTLADITYRHSVESEPEIEILNQALEADDVALLEKLDPYRNLRTLSAGYQSNTSTSIARKKAR